MAPESVPVTPSLGHVGATYARATKGVSERNGRIAFWGRRPGKRRWSQAHALHYGHPGRKLSFLAPALNQKVWLERHTIEAEDAPAG